MRETIKFFGKENLAIDGWLNYLDSPDPGFTFVEQTEGVQPEERLKLENVACAHLLENSIIKTPKKLAVWAKFLGVEAGEILNFSQKTQKTLKWTWVNINTGASVQKVSDIKSDKFDLVIQTATGVGATGNCRNLWVIFTDLTKFGSSWAEVTRKLKEVEQSVLRAWEPSQAFYNPDNGFTYYYPAAWGEIQAFEKKPGKYRHVTKDGCSQWRGDSMEIIFQLSAKEGWLFYFDKITRKLTKEKGKLSDLSAYKELEVRTIQRRKPKSEYHEDFDLRSSNRLDCAETRQA